MIAPGFLGEHCETGDSPLVTLSRDFVLQQDVLQPGAAGE